MNSAEPDLRFISMGAGVQTTSLALLAARGRLGHIDGLIFADTGWEPAAVYAHLQRLDREILQPAGLPLHVVRSGNIRDDALDPTHRFASMPLFVKPPAGEMCPACDGSGSAGNGQRCLICRGAGNRREGRVRRQCTSEYKLKPIRRRIRRELGAELKPDGVPGRVTGGRWAQTLIGYSTDEADRAENIRDVRYARSRFPLLELGWSRGHCQAFNEAAGFDAEKSACIGCPYRTNREWRRMRDQAPGEFADAAAFDAAIRHGAPRANTTGAVLRGENYLHRSMLPLANAPIDRVGAAEWRARQGDLVALADLAEFEQSLEDDSSLNGCSPYACRTGEDVGDDDLDPEDIEAMTA